MKRQLTPEQAQARDARREKFKQLVKQVAAMSDTERAALALNAGAVVTVEGKALSPINTMLCFMQLPNVSVVGGFRQWLKAGRCVRKGQHGATIWVPLGTKAEPTGDGDRQAFGTGTVFDIAQTDEVAKEETAAA